MFEADACRRPTLPSDSHPLIKGQHITEAGEQKQLKIYIECTNTYHSPVQTGIQRVVRNILLHAEKISAARGYQMIPVVCSNGELREADLARVLRDKIGLPLEPSVSIVEPIAATGISKTFRVQLLCAARPPFRVLRRALTIILPFSATKRFAQAPLSDFGLAWCLLLPWRVLRKIFRLFVPEKPQPVQPAPKEPDPFGANLDSADSHQGNILLLLDASWSLPLWPAVHRFQERGGVTHGVIYDLVPLTHAETSEQSLADAFVVWVQSFLAASGRFHTISRTVASQLHTYLAQSNPGPVSWQVTPFYLGTGLDFYDPAIPVRDNLKSVFTTSDHMFVVVGSIEPRKNHRYILDAFDLLWKTGFSARLVIIGRHGWKNEDLIERIETHTQLNRQLFLFRDISDTELDFAYVQASALVIASESEGFGLPVVEAFHRGLPVLCSDIDIFRELADGRAIFFGLDDPRNLTNAVTKFCAINDPARRTERHPTPWITWEQSAEQLIDGILSETVDQRGVAIRSM